MNLNEFLNWWDGFKAAVDPKFVTPEQWKTLCDTIASLPKYQSLPNVFPLPRLYPGIMDNGWPKIGDPVTLPSQPHIWCKHGETEGMPIHVGTPLNNFVAN